MQKQSKMPQCQMQEPPKGQEGPQRFLAFSVGTSTNVAESPQQPMLANRAYPSSIWNPKPSAESAPSRTHKAQHRGGCQNSLLGWPTSAVVMPFGAQLQPPRLSNDVQPLRELIGGNWLFIVFMPYFVATALHDTHLRVGLLIATVISGMVLLLGLLVFMLNMRKIFPHILEMMMPIIFVVQLGVSYHRISYEKEVIRTYSIITHSALAGVCLASMLTCYPVGYQTAQELVHRMYMTNAAVHRVGLYTTAVLTGSLVTSCLLYLVPLCKGLDDRHSSALNLIFRLVYPCLATFLALLFMRIFPHIYLPNLAVVHGLNRSTPDRMSAYLADIMARRPPAILDANMFHSAVDTTTEVKHASAIGGLLPSLPPSSTIQGPLTRLDIRADKLVCEAPVVPPPRQMTSVASKPGLPHGDWLPTGNGVEGTGSYGGVRRIPAPGTLPAGPRSVYTYLAAGPPAKPPLAVYAVYGKFDSLQVMNDPLQYQSSNKRTPYGIGVSVHDFKHNIPLQSRVTDTILIGTTAAPAMASPRAGLNSNPGSLWQSGLDSCGQGPQTLVTTELLSEPIGPVRSPTHPWEPLPPGQMYAKPMVADVAPCTRGTVYSPRMGLLQRAVHGIHGIQRAALPVVTPGRSRDVETAIPPGGYGMKQGSGPMGGIIPGRVQGDMYGLLAETQATVAPPVSLLQAPRLGGQASRGGPPSQLVVQRRPAIAAQYKDESFGLDAEVNFGTPQEITPPT